MPDFSNPELAQCQDCGHHFQISPRGEIQGGACPDCGGKRLFRMQPNPVQSEGTLRNMVDMETGKDAGGNPDGEGILAPPSGRAILTAFMGEDVTTCHHCGWKTYLQPGESACPKCHWPFDADPSSGIPAELRPEIAGAPLTEGTIMGTEHTDPYDTGAHGRDEYTHSHIKEADYQDWTNWETWHTKLMLDNERHLQEQQDRMAQEGWNPEQIRDWTVKHLIGPENKRKLEDAREWNEIPEAERTDPHYEEVANKGPQHKDVMEAWFGGPDLSDTTPNLIDPELVNWNEIHHNIHDERSEELKPPAPPTPRPVGPDPRLDQPGKDVFPSEWASHVIAEVVNPMQALRCPRCGGEIMTDAQQGDAFCTHCDKQWPIHHEMRPIDRHLEGDTLHDLYQVPDVPTGPWTQQIPQHWGKIAGEMDDILGFEPPQQKTNLNWTLGMKGRGIVIGGEPHTWNAFDPNKVWKSGDTGLFHPQYVESLGVKPEHVDWDTGIEIEPDGRVVAVGGHNAAPFIAADPRLKHVEENFFSFPNAMPTTSRTNNMEPYESLWTREADVQFDQGPLQNAPSQSPPFSVVVQPSEAGVHGAHTGRKGVLSFLDAHINGIPVRGHGSELITKYGFRKSPDFGKPLVVAVHDAAHLPIAVESLQHPAGQSASIANLIPKIQSGEVTAPPGIDPQTLQPLPGAMPEGGVRISGMWGDLGAAALTAGGLALAVPTGGADLPEVAAGDAALLGGGAAAEGAGAADAAGASGTAGGLMSKAMGMGTKGLAAQEGMGIGEKALGLGGGGGGETAGGGGGYSGPLQQFTHVLAAFVQSDLHLPNGQSIPESGSIPRHACLNCRVPSAMNEYGECQNCGYTIPYDGGEWEDQVGADRLLDPAYLETGDGYHWKNPSLMPPLGPVHQGRTADYETPASNPDVGIKHDDPEDVDQKEFNDQDKSPENPMNPNLQDSGASGEDEVRKNMGKPSQGQFSPDSPAIQRMEMLMPLIEKHYHEGGGANDPMLKGLHEMLEAENPGYLNNADVEAAERFMQNKKKPDHVHAAIHEAIMPPMQQGNLNAQQQALDPTGLNPSLQPSSQTPPGGGVQQGHCARCGGVTGPDGSCPQCGAAGAQPQAPLPGGPSQIPHPQTFAHTDLLASLVDSANHQGPVTPEQIAAVQQFLIQEGRVDEVPNVPLDPGNPEYAKILAEIQNNPMNPPTVTPEEQTQPPPPQPQAPGGMPVPGMAPGETGGQPMQPMSSFLPDFEAAADDDLTQRLDEATCPKCGGLEPGEASGSVDVCSCDPLFNRRKKKTAADTIAPRCPRCGSGTTGMVGDQEHSARCHACHNIWKVGDIVSDENYGQTSIAKTALRDERQHGGQGEQANPIGVPAAEQAEQTNQGGDEDSSLTWKDSTGAPLKAGQQYQMINPSFSLPDLVRIERVKPDGIDVTLLGTYANDPTQHDPNMLTSSTPISKQDMDLQQRSFEPAYQTADDQNTEPPAGSAAPGHAQVPPSGQTTDEQTASEPQMAAQSSVDPDCPRCGHREFTSAMITSEATEHSCFRCGR